ncbi:MAG: HAD hydrolase-like protein [Firmicutes bacterium]|nr:HAD hydrolase-like protein [Bacillota bacterium]
MKKYFVAFDSDGCVFDAMEPKHKLCFGPAAVSVFGFEDFKDEFLRLWNDINLYSCTRGINRFLGLIDSFDKIKKTGRLVPDLEPLVKWTKQTDMLSAKSLENYVKNTDSPVLKKVLQWSDAVNSLIEQTAESIVPFENAKSAFEIIANHADIAAVSSANTAAITREWEKFGFSKFAVEICGQEKGTKAQCLSKFKNSGYNHMLMVGDAPGDKKAAEESGALFFPILPGNEERSWEALRDKYFPQFLNGMYDTNNEYIKDFDKLCKTEVTL